MTENIPQYKIELEAELDNILSYWIKFAIDGQHGGFIGKVNQHNQQDYRADKGSVLNARILWAFSAAYRLTQRTDYLTYAQRAYNYFTDHFIDKKFGGVYWSVDCAGTAADKKKQVYAQSFAVYALSEYYMATGIDAAKELAIDLFDAIEQYSFDGSKGGYIDAFKEDWTAMDDIRLSEKDANEKKTMNTHLHILEAYTSLYRAWSNEILKTRIEGLLHNFADHIIDDKTNHLVLFFDEDWNRKSTIISYGHDIEAAWLLQEAAEAIDDENLIALTKQMAVKIANAAKEGVDADGGLWYEFEPQNNHLIKEKHWWPQAEAMVGFFNAWQVSGKEEYLQFSLGCWNFTKQHIIDHANGEWYWGIEADYSTMKNQDKIGAWKCPYHNSRACIEIVKRIAADK